MTDTDLGYVLAIRKDLWLVEGWDAITDLTPAEDAFIVAEVHQGDRKDIRFALEHLAAKDGFHVLSCSFHRPLPLAMMVQWAAWQDKKAAELLANHI